MSEPALDVRGLDVHYGDAQALWSVDLTGVNARKIPTPLDGSDPSWGPIRP